MKNRLDLMNNRMPFKNVNNRVYDSLEDVHSIKSPTKQERRPKIYFDKQIGHDDIIKQKRFHCGELRNPPTIDSRGSKIETFDRAISSPISYTMDERTLNSYDLQLNDAARIFHNAVDYGIAEVSTIDSGSPPPTRGLIFSNTDRLPRKIEETHLGPGEYDVNKWESSRYGLSSPSMKFSEVPTGRMDVSEVDTTPSPTTYFKERSSKPKVVGVVPFNTAKRFVNDQPAYLAWTGQQLSPDFDGAVSWTNSSPVNLSKQPSRESLFPGQGSSDYSIDFIPTDTGHKMTIATSAKKSPLNYSYPFKSTKQVGLEVPIPESGTIGPGNYRGACDKSSLEIKLPAHASPTFAIPRPHIDIPLMGSNFDTSKPRYERTISVQQEHIRVTNATTSPKTLPSCTAPCLGKMSMKLWRLKHNNRQEYTDDIYLSHMELLTKAKMSQIYPKLAKKKFSNGATI